MVYAVDFAASMLTNLYWFWFGTVRGCVSGVGVWVSGGV
jgi:hypothetical protein